MASTFKIADLVVTSSQHEPKTLSNVVLINDLIYDIVFSECTPASILRLARTCKSAHAAVKYYMQRAFKIDRILSRFFTSPLAFRQLQARTGSLISGSAALQFFDRSYYPESDLDIYVPFKHRIEVGLFLFKEGYQFEPGRGQDDGFHATLSVDRRADFDEYDFRGVHAVLTFVKNWVDGTATKAQMIVAISTPMEAILGFHSTCVMNLISYEMAYSLYPKATFEKRTSLTSVGTGPHNETKAEAHYKYYLRGWDVQDEFSESEREKDFYTHAFRWLGDKRCWSIPLDTSFITKRVPLSEGSKPMIRDPVVISNWVLTWKYRGGANMSANVFSDPNLACSYVTDPFYYSFQSYRTRLRMDLGGHRRTDRDRDFINWSLSRLRSNREGNRPIEDEESSEDDTEDDTWSDYL
ncbi:hypothetical protein QCA50_014190 [Cerrena zonata]|uniref:F-box domain-containing protein n=1 Tax=Cerrena zonata TaxID=2478898 RepID=A0AAW0FPY8_9APHY